MNRSPAFLVTIDVEGDNLWSRPRGISTENASFLPRFHDLCKEHGIRPTYLTNWEMANDRRFRLFGRDAVRSNTGEIGMHLHAWNSPPSHDLTGRDWRIQPFLVEYPSQIMDDKIRAMTECLENVFETRIASHRAGRWVFNEHYARTLADLGYRTDCSVTPHVLHAAGWGDYRRFPEHAYFLDLNDVSRPGESSLLEVPVSIRRNRVHDGLTRLAPALENVVIARRLLSRLFPARWLRPNGRNLDDMLALMREALARPREYVMFMLHSSELMPGGSPYFPSESSVEGLYRHLEILFTQAASSFAAMTLNEFRRLAEGPFR